MLSGPRSENEQNRLKPWSAASLARPTVGAEKRLKTPKKENKLNRRWTRIYADGVVGGLAKLRILRSFAPIERKISIENLILARNSASAFRYY
jgi:hypothetical protein